MLAAMLRSEMVLMMGIESETSSSRTNPARTKKGRMKPTPSMLYASSGINAEYGVPSITSRPPARIQHARRWLHPPLLGSRGIRSAAARLALDPHHQDHLAS
eukprot:TRINITY_DN4868_c0_g1_i1.p4 TRINITY_DN4868_c0_g1~~TRINITY_DN4868_c0_g1_i1.p4  ORF type:complete len:102 (-),score=17.79 TRINITY_DN4868_c0_g1_i1:723-1028(-)